MVVGDADQSIYAFRGANIRNIMDFEQDFPNATSILLEQNYRSTQTILTAANSVIGHNKGRKEKQLWSDAGDGERIIGLRRRRPARRGAVRLRRDRQAGRRRCQGRRRRGLLPHQRAVASLRGSLHPHRPALPRGRRGALLRAARDPRRAGLPAAAGQRRRRRLAPADPQRPQARHRRPRGREHPGAGHPRRADLLGGAAPREGRARAGHPVPGQHRGLRRDDRGAPVDGRRGGAARRRSGVGARALRLPQVAGGVRGPAGRDPSREPRRARRGRPRVRRRPRRRAVGRPRRRRRRHRRSRSGRLPRAGVAGRRHRPDPRRHATAWSP